MAQEEKKESYNMQIKISQEMKEKLEQRAEETGTKITTYVISLIINDLKNI